MKTKRCTKCGETKPLSEFSKKTASPDGLRWWCKTCTAIYQRQYLARNREKRAAYQREYYILYTYGLTMADYNAMLKTQGGVCAICGEAQQEDRHLAIDHDHETNEIRGLLCDACNVGLGSFRDDPAFLRSAADYLDLLNKEKPKDDQEPTD